MTEIIKPIYHNMDKLEITFQGAFPTSLIDILKETKEEAQASKKFIPLELGKSKEIYKIWPTGLGGFSLGFVTADDGIQLSTQKSDDKGLWNIFVGVRSWYLALNGYETSRDRVLSILDDLGVKASENKKVEKKKTKKVEQATTEVDTKAFKITEAEIKSNPAYAIITDEKLSEKEKLQALHDLKHYNSELSEEENQLNREASNQFLLYVENQLMQSSQRSIDFTNDNAFALYDQTVQDLFQNIGTFKGYIEPFVKALEVLQRARDEGIPANELIEHVSKLEGESAQMYRDKSAKEGELEGAQKVLDQMNDRAEQIANELDSATHNLEDAKTAKSTAEKSWNVFTRGDAIEAAEENISFYKGRIENLSVSAKTKASDIEEQNAKISQLETDITELETKLAKAEDDFENNEDFLAISTLIEITGEDFKDKRQEVVGSAQEITKNAIKGIENSIGRFDNQ